MKTRVTYWYKHGRKFGYLHTLEDGTKVIISEENYIPGFFLHINEVEDFRILS